MRELNGLIDELCSKGIEYKKFYDIATYTRGVSYKKSQEVNNRKTGYKLLRANNISLSSNRLNFDDVKIIDFSVKIKDNQMLKKNDILICAGSGSKEHIGKVAFIEDDIDYTFGGFMGVIRVDGKQINAKYLFHIMTSPIFKKHLSKVSNTSTINNINKDTWKDFKIPVPSLTVQNGIVHILENFTILSEKLCEEMKARQKQYDYYASELFLKSEGKEIEMSELADFIYGYTDKAKEKGDTRFIRITDIDEQGYLKNEDKKYIDMNQEAKKSVLKKGDLVMARTGATYGKTLYFDKDFPSVYASFLIKIIPRNEKLLNKYYWHFTKTSLYWNQANKLVTNGGQPQFNTPAIKKIKIPVPSLEEQERIVKKLDKIDKLGNDIFGGLPAEIEARKKQYEYYRDKLLTFKEVK